MYSRTGWGWFFCTAFLALCIWLLSSTEFNLGIDLRGGTELSYQLDLGHITDNPENVANEVKDIISRRLDLYGLKEIRIAVEGQDRLVVTIPGGDPESTKFIEEQIEKAGNLRLQLVAANARDIETYKNEEANYQIAFRAWAAEYRAWKARVEADSNSKGPASKEPAPKEPDRPRYVVRDHWDKRNEDGSEGTVARPVETLVLDNSPGAIVEGSSIESAAASIDENTRPAVAFKMRSEGAQKLGDLTGQNVGQRLAIVLDDRVLSAPEIKSRISTSGQITGRFSAQEVTGLVTTLNGGSLPSKPELLSRNKVGSVFGEASIRASFRAVVIGLAAVMLTMACYYLFAGLVANFALVFNIAAVLAYVVCFRQTLTLPGIAGILLTIGMAVDANILIFERVREERKNGRSLVQALSTGYQRAFGVIFDSNLTTIITGVVLLNFGTGPVKGFAVTLIAGILISFVSAIFVTRLVISTALHLNLVKKFNMLEAFDTPSIGFVRIQKPCMLGTMLLIVASWCVVVPRGKANYGIDFTGGARIGVSLPRSWPRRDADGKPGFESFIRDLETAHPDLFRDWSLQAVQNEQGEFRDYVLLTRAGAEGSAVRVAGAQAADSDGDRKEEAAQEVRKVLAAALEKSGQLLPEPFAGSRWTESGAKSTFHLMVNLLPLGDDVSKDDLRELINEELDKDPRLAENPGQGFPGIRAERVELVQGATDERPVTTYEVLLTAYSPPAVATTEDGVPTTEQLENTARAVFRSDAVKTRVSLSEPFPTVSTVGPVVASNLQGKALVAFFVAMLGIIFYVSLRFEFIFGLAAIVALLHDVLLTVGVMAVTDTLFGSFYSIKINLPEVAALLTIIGYSINDTIIVFDRIRENMKVIGRKRLSFAECVDLSINQTLSRTIITSGTTLLTVSALLVFGGDAVRGFAFTFLVGLITGTYSSVFIASPILLWLHQRALARREALEAQMA